jgi:O-acetylserine/cysteine efflux transporter
MQTGSVIFVELMLFFVSFVWGLHPAVMKIGLVSLPFVAYNALRMLLAAPVLWLVVFATGRYRPLAREDVKAVLLISLAGFFAFQMLFVSGVERTTAGNASLIGCLLPVAVAVINRVWRIEPLSRATAAGIAASLAGVALIVAGSGKEVSLAGRNLLGALLLLGSQFCYGYYTVFSRPLLDRYSPYQVTAWVVTVSAVLFACIALPDFLAISWARCRRRVAERGVFGGGGHVRGQFAVGWGVGRIGSARTSLFNNVSPVFAVASGYLLLGEEFGLLQLAGAVVIFWGYTAPAPLPARRRGNKDTEARYAVRYSYAHPVFDRLADDGRGGGGPEPRAEYGHYDHRASGSGFSGAEGVRFRCGGVFPRV